MAVKKPSLFFYITAAFQYSAGADPKQLAKCMAKPYLPLGRIISPSIFKVLSNVQLNNSCLKSIRKTDTGKVLLNHPYLWGGAKGVAGF